MRDLLAATDRLDSGEVLTAEERIQLLDGVRHFDRSAAGQVAKLRTQLARAEEFAATLGKRLEQ